MAMTKPSAAKEPVDTLLAWLSGVEGRALDEAALVAGLGGRLRAAGLPVDRLAALRWTLHPGVLAAAMSWTPDRPVQIYDREHGFEPPAAFAVGRLHDALVMCGALNLQGEALSLVAIEALRGDGLVEQVILPCAHADGPFRAIAFATAQRSGFIPAERAIFERVAPALAARLCAAGRRTG